jgi:CRISPR/Cas system-associated exonuclease Cas4 (RecB family)
MRLVTNADLNRSEEELAPLITQAQKLAELWIEFIKQDSDSYEYTVVDHGERARAAGIHGSEMSKCMLKVVYSIMGTERKTVAETMDANMKLRMRTGTAIHRQLQTDFRRMAAWYTKNYRDLGYAMSFDDELGVNKDLQVIAAEWELSSSCDGAFTFWRWDGTTWAPYLRVGVEIKTSSDPSYVARKKPEADHLEQTCLYQACLDLPLMWVLYYNKSNSNFTTPYSPWLFKFDRHKWENDLEMRFAKAHHYADTRQLPDRAEGRHCAWCAFAWTCNPKILSKPKYGAPALSPGMLVRK